MAFSRPSEWLLAEMRRADLELSLTAFGSSYTREANFSDNEWLGRLHNPLARTFVAMSADDIIASTTLSGPAASTAEDMRFLQEHTSKDACSRTDVAGVYHISGMHTRPESRGHGLGKALLEAALEDLAERLRSQGQQEDDAVSLVRADVFVANVAARALYSAAGFATTTEHEHEGSAWADQGRDGLSMWRRA